MVEEGSVETVLVEENRIEFTALDDEGAESTFITGRMEDPQLTDRLLLTDVKFEKERLPTISGCSVKVNLLTKDHVEITNDLRKRFIITYESRYRTALQRFMNNLKAGSMQRSGFWSKLFKRGRVSFKSVNPVINEMFTLAEVAPFNGYDSTLKFDILGEIKGIGTYYNNYNPDIYMSVSEDTPGKLTDGVIGNIMSKYIL